MNNGRFRQVSQMHMPQIQVDRKDLIVCDCGGFGVLFQGAFLPRQNPVIGENAIVPALVIVCTHCGTLMEPPYKTKGTEVPEAEKPS